MTRVDGVAQPAPFFNEDLPLPRGVALPVTLEDGRSVEVQSPVLNPAPGAIGIQNFFENVEWAMQSADANIYASLLRTHPLPGVGPKRVLIQFAVTDQTVPNFSTADYLRAGDLADRAVLYRHDLAYADNPKLPKNPHGFPFSPMFSAVPAIPAGVLEQIALFFASDGTTVIQPEPKRYFEMPVSPALPDGTHFIP